MNKLVEEIIKPILEASPKIKKVIGVYGGRFQPFGPHHLKTYKWLAKQVDEAYITTSNIKKPPRHPMNFKEKVRHMSKMGVPSNRIVQEKSPYVAKKLMSKFDSNTAVVYVFGAKDAGRLGGSGKYFQDYKKNKKNLKGHEEHGYYLVAPHVSMNVGGKEVSGTSMRELLGSSKIDDSERVKLFKKMFGYYDKGVFNMLTNKFKKLFEGVDLPIEIGDTVRMGKFKNKKVVIKKIEWNEKGDLLINGRPAMKFRLEKKTEVEEGYPNEEDMKKIRKRVKKARSKSDSNKEYQYHPIEEFLTTIDFKELIKEASNASSAGTDDGPNFFYPKKSLYKNRGDKEAGKLGWKVVNYILGDEYDIPEDFPIYPDGPVKSVSYLPAGVGSGRTPNHQEEYVGTKSWNKWLQHMRRLSKLVGYELIDYLTDKEDVIDDTVETQKVSTEEEPQETKKKDKDSQHDEMEVVKESVFSKNWWKELLNEGGAYGHMAHPFDDKDLTFGDLKKIIELGLGGNLSREDNVTEKLDGQNIMISWKDGKLIAARNKGHIKNGGKTALDAKGIASKFKGRGDIRNAFVYAMKDLEKSIKGLSQKQKDKIFNNGYNFMNMEVMWPKSSNVINYDKAELVFHGALKYDDKGNVKGEVKGSGRILAGMIKQINQHIQKKYKIGKPVFLEVPKHQDFGKMKGKFLGRLSKLQSEFGLKDNDTLGLYHQRWWERFIRNGGGITDEKVVKGLTKRWAFFDKKYSIPMMKKDIKDESTLEWVLKFDKKDHASQVKNNMRPFEVLFFEVGAEILKNVKGFMAANPDKAVQNMRKKLDKAINTTLGSGDKKKLNTLYVQLDRLNSIGGTKAIVPSEGIVFKYKGKTYKFTGAFAPINQITGLISF